MTHSILFKLATVGIAVTLGAAASQARAQGCGQEPNMRDYTIYKGEGKDSYPSDAKAYYDCVNKAREAEREKGDENHRRVLQSLADQGVRKTAAEEMRRRFEEVAGIQPGTTKMDGDSALVMDAIQQTSKGAYAAGGAGKGIPRTIAKTSTNSAIDAAGALAATFDTAMRQAGAADPQTAAGGSNAGNSLGNRFGAALSASGSNTATALADRQAAQRQYEERTSELSAEMVVARRNWQAEQERHQREYAFRVQQEIQAKAWAASRQGASRSRSSTEDYSSEIGRASGGRR